LNKQQEHIPITVKDFLVSGESFTLEYDSEKQILVTSPQPLESKLSSYYESENYISHTDSNKGLFAWLYQTVKKHSLSKKVGVINSFHKQATTVLDIGAGTGDFLIAAKNNGWSVQGVEPNEKARSLASLKGVDLLSDISAFKGKQFDVVTLWHVLEHLPNLDEVLKEIEALVKPNGTLIIAVPNHKSYDAKHYREFWAAYDVPRHLWHFSKKSFDRLFSENMLLKKTKPMIFDSFYVSLLSEKYKSGAKFSINALLVGFWSNFKALSTGEYSSLIYCFQKEK